MNSYLFAAAAFLVCNAAQAEQGASRSLASTSPVNGTFTMVRGDGSCTAVTAVVRSPVDDDCMRMSVADVWKNMAPVVRYMENEVETEVSIGSIVVKGGVPGNPAMNLSYACPPDGYNGFDRAFGSFCEVTPDTQLWGTFSEFESKLLKAIRVILANSFPAVDTLEDDEPPFGTALFEFPDGIDLQDAADGDELAICEAQFQPSCPMLPGISGLNTKLQCTSFGYFGAKALGATQIQGNWYQDDAQQLLSGITSPSNTGGLQEFYFNASGFFLHSFNDPDGGPETCDWFPFCDYECEVYNYDSRFFDDHGTWNVTWKLNQEYFDVSYSKNSSREVRAYFGNAIDAAGIFPSIIYTNVEQTAFLGLDKIGSAEATRQPDYAYDVLLVY